MNSNSLLSITVFTILLCSSTLFAQLSVKYSVIGNGYTDAVSVPNEDLSSRVDTTYLSGTVGQTIISKSSDNSFALSHGFWYQLSKDIVTGIEEGELVPEIFELKQNYPNPFNPGTKIVFNLPKAVDVQLTIYNILGQEVGTLVDERLAAGEYDITFEARDLAAGLYFYRIQAGSFIETKKMLLVK